MPSNMDDSSTIASSVLGFEQGLLVNRMEKKNCCHRR
jgi:hypothetical protein